jgi:hypothetical protein
VCFFEDEVQITNDLKKCIEEITTFILRKTVVSLCVVPKYTLLYTALFVLQGQPPASGGTSITLSHCFRNKFPDCVDDNVHSTLHRPVIHTSHGISGRDCRDHMKQNPMLLCTTHINTSTTNEVTTNYCITSEYLYQ